MDRMILNQLSQNLSDLRTACQEQCALDNETELVFQDLATEIDNYCRDCMGEPDNQLLYLQFLRCFDKIRTFLDSRLSSNELQRMAENLLEIVACPEYDKIAQYFV